MENKLAYIKVGDYYIPNLFVKPSPPIGKYGRMRRDYLRIRFLHRERSS